MRAPQPFDTAIAAAVVGPPMLALEAIIISSMEKLNILPKMSDTIIFTATIMSANTRRSGDSFIIIGMEAGAPITAKKM